MRIPQQDVRPVRDSSRRDISTWRSVLAGARNRCCPESLSAVTPLAYHRPLTGPREHILYCVGTRRVGGKWRRSRGTGREARGHAVFRACRRGARDLIGCRGSGSRPLLAVLRGWQVPHGVRGRRPRVNGLLLLGRPQARDGGVTPLCVRHNPGRSGRLGSKLAR